MKLRPSILISLLACLLAGAGSLPSCHRETKSKPKKKAEAMAQLNKERSAVIKFALEARKVFEWRLAQPVPSSESERRNLLTELSRRMEKIPADDLPDDLDSPWQRMLQCWKSLAENSNPAPTLRETGAQAAAELNKNLAARGIVEIRF